MRTAYVFDEITKRDGFPYILRQAEWSRKNAEVKITACGGGDGIVVLKAYSPMRKIEARGGFVKIHARGFARSAAALLLVMGTIGFNLSHPAPRY